MLPSPSRVPQATYRLQFNSEFAFKDAQSLVPYLRRLGISEIYASPIFQASSSSSHGYDVNDYGSISRALGGRKELNEFSAALHQHDLGLLIDFVPNHMGIDGEYNAWWRDVLENGKRSRYASYFDIEWHPRIERLNDRVLVPMLETYYGSALTEGLLSLGYESGRFFILYRRFKLPLRPETYGDILARVVDQLPSGDARRTRLREIEDGMANLPAHDLVHRDECLQELRSNLALLLSLDQSLYRLVEKIIQTINGDNGNASSFESLHLLLEQQHYRLTHWKVGAHEVNYRRFFAVDTLVGLKMEEREVFDSTHQLLGDLLSSRTISGVRLDHIDGLWNPLEYLQRLSELVDDKHPGGPIYTLVEKILARSESLPNAWPIHGTTGYEFAASLIDLFLDRKDEPDWTRIYESFIADDRKSSDLTYEDKLFALQEIFPNAVANLAVELDALIESDWLYRDISLHDFEIALAHLLVCLPTYRSYRMPGEEMTQSEMKFLSHALDEAIRRNPLSDPFPLRFVVDVLMGHYPAPGAPTEYRLALDRWTCKFQQATGAVMAKSVEDTHFYRYVRMFAANEVGSHPSRFGQSVDVFHQTNARRLKETPLCLLTTSTHDTKLSEDSRARLFALAELPLEWERKLRTWHEMNGSMRRKIANREAPDPREEYLLYQILLAAWPLNPASRDECFRRRTKDYFLKAQSEAKLNTHWSCPQKEWEEAGALFVETVLQSTVFIEDFAPFARRIAQRGLIFSLAQVALKLTCPGVPDIYQGNEIWDFSLVDPDNRRAIDFHGRIALLDQLETRMPEHLWQHWEDGGIKMRITQTLLQCRRSFPELFAQGDYIPLQVQGKNADFIVAFMREHGSAKLLVIAPRRLGTGDTQFPDNVWSGIEIPIPTSSEWKNVFTGELLKVSDGVVPIAQAFCDWPVAVFLSTYEARSQVQ